MSKHTSGPWRANGCEIIGNSRVVATVHWCSGMHEEDRANIALIESAPALLEALENAEQQLDYGQVDVALRVIRAAIAAAKGDA